MSAKKTDKADNQDPSFEDALSELEGIVKAMEEGKLNLDDSLTYFERGSKLIQFCDAKLKESSKKIEILRQTGPGEAEWQDYEEDS